MDLTFKKPLRNTMNQHTNNRNMCNIVENEEMNYSANGKINSIQHSDLTTLDDSKSPIDNSNLNRKLNLIEVNDNKIDSIGVDIGRLSNNNLIIQKDEGINNLPSTENTDIDIENFNSATREFKRKGSGIIKKKVIKSRAGSVIGADKNDCSNNSKDIKYGDNGKNEEKRDSLINPTKTVNDSDLIILNKLSLEAPKKLNFNSDVTSVPLIIKDTVVNCFNTAKNENDLKSTKLSFNSNNEKRGSHNNFRNTNTNNLKQIIKIDKQEVPRTSNKFPVTLKDNVTSDKKNSQSNNITKFLDPDKVIDKKFSFKENLYNLNSYKSQNNDLNTQINETVIEENENNNLEQKQKEKNKIKINQDHNSTPTDNPTPRRNSVNKKPDTNLNPPTPINKLDDESSNLIQKDSDLKTNDKILSTPPQDFNNSDINLNSGILDNSQAIKTSIDFNNYEDVEDVNDDDSDYDDEIFDENCNINEIKSIYKQAQKEFVEICADSIENVRKESSGLIVNSFI